MAGSLFCRASVARNLQDVSDVGHYVWSLGCWTDDKENRVLSEASLMGNLEMTTEVIPRNVNPNKVDVILGVETPPGDHFECSMVI